MLRPVYTPNLGGKRDAKTNRGCDPSPRSGAFVGLQRRLRQAGGRQGHAKKDTKVTPPADTGAPVADLPPVVNPDKGNNTGECTPFTSKANSGVKCANTCKTDADCVAGTSCKDETTGKACAAGGTCVCLCKSADEVCVTGFMDAAGKEVGQCLGKCCLDQNKALDDPANKCQTEDRAQFATCFWNLTGTTDYGACGFICSLDDGSGKIMTWPCPSDMDCGWPPTIPSTPTTRSACPSRAPPRPSTLASRPSTLAPPKG